MREKEKQKRRELNVRERGKENEESVYGIIISPYVTYMHVEKIT